MTIEKRVRGLGVAGLSLMAGLLMSGMVFAQDAEGEPDIVIDDGEIIIVDDESELDPEGDGFEVIDPICIECSGEGIVDDGDAGEGEVITSVDGEVTICEEDICADYGVPVGVEEIDPQILYSSGGEAPTAEVIRSGKGAGSEVLHRGPDLCASPAPELVWLCALVNGKSVAE